MQKDTLKMSQMPWKQQKKRFSSLIGGEYLPYMVVLYLFFKFSQKCLLELFVLQCLCMHMGVHTFQPATTASFIVHLLLQNGGGGQSITDLTHLVSCGQACSLLPSH